MNMIESSKAFLVVEVKELDIMKEALDSYHAHLLMVLKDLNDDKEEIKVIDLITKTEQMCVFLGIPGY